MAETQPAPGPGPGTEMNLGVNWLSRMPSPRGKSSLCFQGKDIEEFLVEYKRSADHANLMNAKKCQEIRIYFVRKEKCVLDVLKSYTNEDWQGLKRELKSLYMSSAKKKTYRPKDIQCFSTRKRKKLPSCYILTLTNKNSQ